MRFEHLFGFGKIGGERLLDQHWNAALDRRHDGIDVQMLVGADDGGGHFRPLEQFDVALRDEIGADFGGDFAGAVRVFLGEPDPFDRRMARRHLAAKQADAAAADDGEADAFCGFLHDVVAPAGLSPARFLSFSSAIPEMVSLVSGRSIGSLRSADKSAAL